MRTAINILSKLITPTVAMTLLPAFKASYGMAAYAADTFDFLGWEKFREQIIPHLKNWAIEYELQRRAKEGIIPFECSVVSNSKRNHNHIELRKDGFVLTVSQTHGINSMPRECVFRNEHCMDGQIALSGFESGDSEFSNEVYAILTHGGGGPSPTFVLCGIPNPNMSSWAQHVNLIDIVHGITLVDPSPINDDIKLDYRNKVKELAKDIE